MTILADLQEAAGITHVVWIDDCFAEPQDEALRVAILAKLKILYDNGTPPRHDAFSAVTADAPEAIRNKQIETALDAISAGLPRVLESLTMQAKKQGMASDPEDDLTPAQVIGLQSGLNNVRSFSYRSWNNDRESILGSADEKTLFLVDREFDKEGMGDAGDAIVADVTSRAPRAYCIMFTHTVGAEGVDSLRFAIAANENPLEAHQFGVMSKRGLGYGVSDITPHFSRSFRTALLCRFCYEVASNISQVMNIAALEAARKMAGFSVETIDTAIFENSLGEGASEFDVVERILAVSQRLASQQSLATNGEAFQRLKRIRDVRAVSTHDLNGQVGVSEPQLHRWRIAEVLDEENYINALHSPLRCGDVFEHVRSGKRYVLLAQPCDLLVRGKEGSDFGKRRRDEADLVLANSNC